MRALVVPEAGRLAFEDVAHPEPGPYDALVRVEVCGICNSTDAKLIDGKMYWAPPFPFILGHETVGRVIETGPKVRNFRVGDRVTRPLAFWPDSRPDLNVAMGGFAEWGVVRDARAMAADGDPSLLDDYTAQRQIVVPEGLSAREAALAISLSETASVLRQLPTLHSKRIAVMGTGVVGLAFTLWAKLAGAFVVTLGRRAVRLELARTLGADEVVDTSSGDFLAQVFAAVGGPVDGLIEATGDAALAGAMLRVLEPGGFASAYGVPPTGVSYAPRWRTAVVEEHLSFAWVADLIARNWVRPEWFVSHEWAFEDLPEAVSQVRRGEVLKGFVHLHREGA